MHLFSLSEGQEPRHGFKSILHTAADNPPDTGLPAGLLCSRAEPGPQGQLPHGPPVAGEEAWSGLGVLSGPYSIF